MFTSDLLFDYPEKLVAKEPQADFRSLFVDLRGSTAHPELKEFSKSQIVQLFQPGDVLAINNTKVLPRRVMAPNGLEILFLKMVDEPVSRQTHQNQNQKWQVLFQAREVKDGQAFALPSPAGQNIEARLITRGLPQTLEVSEPLTDEYFQQFAELALPPYIQKARGERRNRTQDRDWYQTAWAKAPGSFAAPTASLHFTNDDLKAIESQGVQIAPITLHVGLGTFLPIKSARLDEHQMHFESVEIPNSTEQKITHAKANGGRVWALGTTVTRALESWAQGKLQETEFGWGGETDLFIRPGYNFKLVDCLLTNFHQPGSTLLALVSAFAGDHKLVLNAYEWAIQKDFRLFSYGDLTIWMRR